MSDLTTAVAAYITARSDADSAPPWARIMREDVAAARMRELLAACFAADVSLDDALVLHAPDYVRGEAERWGTMVARISPPAPVVLGPWRRVDGVVAEEWVRLMVGTKQETVGLRATVHGWADYRRSSDLSGERRYSSPQPIEEVKSAADRFARRRVVVLDAEPLPEPVALGAWNTDLMGRRFRATASPGPLFCAIAVGPEGWGVSTRPILTYPPARSELAAHGPQTGAEGERLAVVAALALGFVEGA